MKKNVKAFLSVSVAAGMIFSNCASAFALGIIPNVTLSENFDQTEKTISVDGIFYTVTSSPSQTTPGTVVVAANPNCTKINVVIPDTISVYNKSYYVTGISDGAFSENNNVRTISIGRNVEKVSGYSFVDCINLEKISVEAGNKNLIVSNNVLYSINRDKIIYMPSAYNTEYFQVPDTVTEIADCAFYGNRNLREVTLGTALLTIGNYAFNNCINLTKVNTSNSVETIGSYAFAQTAVNNIILSRSLMEIGEGAFLGSNVSSITIPSGVSEIKANTFYNCFNMKGIKLGVNVESIGDYAFSGTALSNFTMPDNLKSIGFAAFADCSQLIKVSSNGKLKSIGSSAFYNCDSLLDFVIPTATEEIGDNAFTGCNHIKSFSVSLNNTNFTDDNGILYTAFCKKLIRYPVGRTDSVYTLPYETDEIAVNALADCRYINEYQVENMNKSFSAEDGILYDLDKHILYAYPSAKISSNFTVPDYVTTIMPRAFAGAILTGTVNIPSYLEELGENAFDNCQGVSSFNLISSNDKFTVIDGVLFSKDEAALICYPSGRSDAKYTVPKSVKVIDTAAFKNAKLKEINLNEGLSVIGNEAFMNSKISEFVLPENLEEIGESAFENTVIKNIVIPDSVNAVGSFAFANCANLRNVTFEGKDVPSVPGYNIFYNTKLEKIIVPEILKKNYIHFFTLTDADCYEDIIK